MRTKALGFTLIEVLVALALTASVAVMAYSGLSSAMVARERLVREEAVLRDLQRFFNLIGRDLRHLVARPVRNEIGELEAAVIAEEDSLLRLALTRNGWDNFAGLPRSNLQRVGWWFEDGQLSRGYWPVLDRATETPLLEAVVLEDVLEFEVRLLDEEQRSRDDAWRVRWPESDSRLDELPVAVEVSVEIEDWGRATRIYLPAT